VTGGKEKEPESDPNVVLSYGLMRTIEHGQKFCNEPETIVLLLGLQLGDNICL
jgi:hypothetical protein